MKKVREQLLFIRIIIVIDESNKRVVTGSHRKRTRLGETFYGRTCRFSAAYRSKAGGSLVKVYVFFLRHVEAPILLSFLFDRLFLVKFVCIHSANSDGYGQQRQLFAIDDIKITTKTTV